MSKWSYTVLSIPKWVDPRALGPKLTTDFGAGGWELTAAVPTADGTTLLFFKRPDLSDPDPK